MTKSVEERLDILTRVVKSQRDTIAELWEALAANHEDEARLADEAIDKAERAQRAVRRLEKIVKELE